MIENLTGTVRYTCMNFQSFVLSLRLMTLWLIRCLMYMYRVSFIENKCLLNNGRKIWSILLCTSSFIIIWIYYYNNSVQYIWTSELIGFLQSLIFLISEKIQLKVLGTNLYDILSWCCMAPTKDLILSDVLFLSVT